MAPRAEADLDEIWLYVAKGSGSIEIGNRLIDTITDRFLVADLGPGYRSMPVGELRRFSATKQMAHLAGATKRTTKSRTER